MRHPTTRVTAVLIASSVAFSLLSGGPAEAYPGAAGALADLSWYQEAGWYRPLVPHDVLDVSNPGNPPAFLRGDQPATHLAYGLQNSSPVPVPSFEITERFDGAFHSSLAGLSLMPFSSSTVARALGATIPGGRHTLGIAFDEGNAVTEADEGNNAWSGQWVWAPAVMLMNVPSVRPGAPLQNGGHSGIPIGVARFPNCDGLRSPDFAPSGNNGYWAIAGIMPSDTALNIDLNLHAPSTGPTSGFESPTASSSAPAGRADFIIMDTDPGSGMGGVLGSRDLGVVLQSGSPSTAYTAQCTESGWFSGSSGTTGPVTMASGRLVVLREFFFDGNDRSVSLYNLTGNADLDLAVVRRSPGTGGSYPRSSLHLLGQVSSARGAGGDEVIPLNGQPADFYAVVVWKSGALDLPKNAGYQIVISNGTTDAESANPPVAGSFRGAKPNPVHRRTTLEFELAQESRVELAIHDLAGRQIRTIASDVFAAGRHSMQWDGRDDSGHELPNGVYLVRFDGGGLRVTRKLTVLR